MPRYTGLREGKLLANLPDITFINEQVFNNAQARRMRQHSQNVTHSFIVYRHCGTSRQRDLPGGRPAGKISHQATLVKKSIVKSLSISKAPTRLCGSATPCAASFAQIACARPVGHITTSQPVQATFVERLLPALAVQELALPIVKANLERHLARQ